MLTKGSLKSHTVSPSLSLRLDHQDVYSAHTLTQCVILRHDIESGPNLGTILKVV